MADTLKFEISYLYVDSTEGISIPVALVSPNGIYNTWAKVVTGAEVCLFSNEVGLRLGLDVERRIPRSLGSAGGTMIDSFGHEVVIQTFGIAMSSIIYFAKFMPSAGLCRVAFQPIRHPLILPTTSSRNQFEKIGII